MAGFHASSSLRIDRQTVPLGYTFGWNRGGTNLPKIQKPQSNESHLEIIENCGGVHLGGFVGYSARRNVSQLYGAKVGLLVGASLTVRKLHGELEQAALPDSLFFARNTALPVLQIKNTLNVARRSCIESKRRIFAPELA